MAKSDELSEVKQASQEAETVAQDGAEQAPAEKVYPKTIKVSAHYVKLINEVFHEFHPGDVVRDPDQIKGFVDRNEQYQVVE